MTVTSYLELYTTLLGWQQFENLWGILTSTGLVFLPFLFIIIEGFISAPSPVAALRDAEIKIAFALTAVVLAAQPVLELDPAVVHYRPLCTETEYSPGNTDTTYDDAFVIPQSTVSVPIWWYGTLALASGGTYAAVLGLDCQTDFRKLVIELDKQRITDPVLFNEVAQFIKDCFVPARSTYYREQTDVQALLDKYGVYDPESFLSKVYRDTPGFYDRRRATTPVSGWLYDPDRDTESGMGPETPGRPYCKEWLENPSIGLRQRLLEQLGQELLDDASTHYTEWGALMGFDNLDRQMAEDAILNGLVVNSVAAAPAGSVFATYTDAKGVKVKLPMIPSDTGVNVVGLMANVGSVWEGLSFAPMMYAVRAGAPMLQALILLGIYMVLPFGIVFSRYSWSFIFIATIAILTLYFWTYLWHVSVWLENRLFMMLFPDGNALFRVAKGMASDPNYLLKEILLKMAVILMFVGFPLLFTMVIAWAGFRIGGAISSVFEQGRQQYARGGRAGIDTAKGVATNLATRRLDSSSK